MAKRETRRLPVINMARSMAEMRISKALTPDIVKDAKNIAETRNIKPLPLDIIHEILVRLPVKILTKFLLVCKQWNSLISNPCFQDEHYCSHQQNRLVIQVQNDNGDLYISTYSKEGLTSIPKREGSRNKEKSQLTRVKMFSLSYDDFSPRVYRFQSCLGLVCVAVGFEHRTSVCNPTTGEQLVLPTTSGMDSCIGFGYAASTKEFKVVRFSNRHKTISCKVFTLGTSVWRKARSPSFPTLRVCLGVAPFIQGALHLLRRIHNDFSITAFDTETEEYRQIVVPKFYYTDAGIIERFGLLSELGGSLSLIGKRGNILELWLLKDYKSGQWVKEYSIDVFLMNWQTKDIMRATPLQILPNGSIIMALFSVAWSELICYNPQDEVAIHMTEGYYCSWALFEESFRSLK